MSSQNNRSDSIDLRQKAENRLKEKSKKMAELILKPTI